MQLLDVTTTRDHPAVILAGKPPGRDRVMESAPKRLNMTMVTDWPPDPVRRKWDYRKGRRGYVLRPEQRMIDPEADNAHLASEFRKAIMDNYRSKTPVITMVDEAHHVQGDLKLKTVCEAPLTRGAPVNGMWSLAQRGAWLSYHTYNAPEHVFVYFDPHKDNRRRYADIGGIDADVVMELTAGLQTYTEPVKGQTISEALYFRRSGPLLVIVDVQ